MENLPPFVRGELKAFRLYNERNGEETGAGEADPGGGGECEVCERAPPREDGALAEDSLGAPERGGKSEEKQRINERDRDHAIGVGPGIDAPDESKNLLGADLDV